MDANGTIWALGAVLGLFMHWKVNREAFQAKEHLRRFIVASIPVVIVSYLIGTFVVKAPIHVHIQSWLESAEITDPF